MANTKVTGDLIASGTITAANLVSGTLDTLLNSYLTTNTYATQGYVTTAVNNLIAAAPASLDTLNELAAALNDDANFATTVTNSLATKLNLSGGTLTGGLHINTTSLPQLLIQNVDGGTNAERIAIELTSGDIFKIRSLNDNNTTRVDNVITANILTGNVGIGTNSPSAKLEVNGTFKSAGIQDSADSLAIFINGNEEVGIGTTSPTQKLDVAGTIRSNAYEGKVKINSTAANGKQYEFISIDTGNLGLYDGTAYRLWVAGSGNVGIGTTSPSQKLHVNGSASIAGNLGIGTTSPSQPLVVNQPNHNDDTVGYDGSTILWRLRNETVSSNPTGRLNLYSNGSSTIQLEGSPSRTTYFNAGNVGIGTTQPDGKLTISAGAENQTAPVNAIRIKGPNSPTNSNSAQNISWDFSYAGSAKIRAHRGASWGTQIDFLTNTSSQGSDNPGVKLSILDNGGITFNGDTAAANALDDYEEGAFTPILKGTTSGQKIATSINIGRYTKIGNLVTVTGTCAWNGGDTLVGLIVIGNLPFTIASPISTGQQYRAGACAGGTSGITMPSGYTNGLAFGADAGTDYIYVMARSTSSYTHTPTIGSSGAVYGFTMTYETTS